MIRHDYHTFLPPFPKVAIFRPFKKRLAPASPTSKPVSFAGIALELTLMQPLSFSWPDRNPAWPCCGTVLETGHL